MPAPTSSSRRAALVLLALGAAATACGGGAARPSGTVPAGESFPEVALVSLPSDSGGRTVEVRTSPEQPPGRGVSSVQLVIRDRSGAPVEGLALTVVPWMPDMGHGTSVVPSVTDQGHGVYLVSNVYLFMPGDWQLRTEVAAQGAPTDHVTADFQIP